MTTETQTSKKIGKIKELIEEYAKGERLSPFKTAVEIYYTVSGLCIRCGASLEVWEEVFSEEHHCEVRYVTDMEVISNIYENKELLEVR